MNTARLYFTHAASALRSRAAISFVFVYFVKLNGEEMVSTVMLECEDMGFVLSKLSSMGRSQTQGLAKPFSRSGPVLALLQKRLQVQWAKFCGTNRDDDLAAKPVVDAYSIHAGLVLPLEKRGAPETVAALW